MARRAWTAAFAATLGALIMFAGGAQASPVLMISLDGLRPDDVAKAAERGIKAPNLQALMREGAYASGVTGVLPTLTYPSHTTLVTGVAPAEHGVSNNQTFDPETKNQQGWYWYASDIRVPTLWQAAHATGLKTANVHWPVSVGAKGIDENLPQIWRTGTPDDSKLLAALATPGLLPRLEAKLGAYAQGIDETVEGDANRVRFAQAMLADRPDFTTVYLAGIDHAEHHGRPGSPEAVATIEKTDALVGELAASARKAMPDVTVVVVSDHGFLPVATDINVFAPFVEAGLIALDEAGKVTSWQAEPWLAGGTAFVVLSQPEDPALLARVTTLMRKLAADPRYHIAGLLDRAATRAMGGPVEAALTIVMEPGYETGRDPKAPLASPSTYKGMHGYVPSLPEMHSTLIVSGPSLLRRGSLGTVDMRAIAPSIARILGVPLPTSAQKAVF